MSDQSLTREEIAAMWLFHDRYASGGLSCVDFYRGLSTSDKQLVAAMIGDILAAKPAR